MSQLDLRHINHLTIYLPHEQRLARQIGGLGTQLTNNPAEQTHLVQISTSVLVTEMQIGRDGPFSMHLITMKEEEDELNF